MTSVMSDNAAKDVGTELFLKKGEMVALLRTHEDRFSPEEIEIMSCQFVDTCITHGGDLASKKHYSMMYTSLKDVIVMYNAATLLQRFIVICILRSHMSGTSTLEIGTLRTIVLKLWANKLGQARYHTPMKCVTQVSDYGTKAKKWELTGDIPCIYSLMTGMSSLISNQGVHKK